MKNQYTFFFILFFLLFSAIIPAVLSEPALSGNFDAITLYNQAVDKAGSGQFEDACNLTEQALLIQPNFTLALITRTNVLLELNRVEEAEITLQKALSLAPDNPAVLATAASFNLRTGRNQKALEYANNAITRDPSLVEAWIIIGTAHGNLGEYDEEINASNQALKLYPNHPLAVSNLDYAKRMMQQKQGKKTPLGLPILFLSLIVFVVIEKRRRS